jgi:hypothetical protein
MTPSAIHEAIRLYKYPKEMAWICQSSSVLPDGITELLRLSSSPEKILTFAEKNHTDAEALQEILLNFIDNVLLNENNSNEKLLGLNESSDIDLVKLHYQLLIKINHPDKNSSVDAVAHTARITKAYTTIKKQQNTSSEFKNIRISRVPPKSFYQATSKAEQNISNIKSTSIAVLTITLLTAVWLGGYIYKPNKPELFTKDTAESQQTAEVQEKDFLDEKQDNQFVMAKSASVANTVLMQNQFQNLLTSVEVAYENGDATKIQTILNSPEIKQQSDKEVLAKLKDLFQITSDRKMLLYDFEWKNVSGQITGKGKFLSRYHLNDNNQWLTREGIASILAIESDNLINITSLKLDNKNIDQ